MKSPVLWILFAVLFACTGVIHFVRARRKGDPRTAVNQIFGYICLVWSASTLTMRFVSKVGGAWLAAAAVAGMIYAAYVSMKIEGNKS